MAFGDSFTEGVGDWDERYPNGVRGWADRVARQLAKADPATEYANLALRSRVLEEVVEDQLPRVLALRPTLVSFFAGGNDLLRVRVDLDRVLDRYEEVVARLSASGARVLLFTSYDVRLSPLLSPLRGRNNQFNGRVRQVAQEHRALLVDHWAMRAYQHPRMWEPDRLHMSRQGHRYLAAAVLRTLALDHTISLGEPEALPRPGLRETWAAERDWWQQWVRPMVGRRMRGYRMGDELGPRWPDPIRPAEGLKKLTRRARRGTASAALRAPGEQLGQM